MFIHRILAAGWVLAMFSSQAEPIFHEKYYPSKVVAAPAVIVLHTSGGYPSIVNKVKQFTDSGYVVYTPDFFKRHSITTQTRFETWTVHRVEIETELQEIIQLMKSDPRIDSKNIFAVGYSNGGYWASYLAAVSAVNAGVTNYGVWDFPGNTDGYPAKYFSPTSHPVLALVGKEDRTQKIERVLPQVYKAQKISPALKLKIVDATHGWDCAPCNSEYIFNEAVTAEALKSTTAFFRENSK